MYDIKNFVKWEANMVLTPLKFHIENLFLEVESRSGFSDYLIRTIDIKQVTIKDLTKYIDLVTTLEDIHKITEIRNDMRKSLLCDIRALIDGYVVDKELGELVYSDSLRYCFDHIITLTKIICYFVIRDEKVVHVDMNLDEDSAGLFSLFYRAMQWKK